MSDGNFNRSLLPRRDYPSGVRAGQAVMRTRALAAFREFLERAFPGMEAEARKAAVEDFARRLL